MGTILWLIAVVLAIAGVFQLLGGEILTAIVLFVLAAAIGPGGWSVFSRRA